MVKAVSLFAVASVANADTINLSYTDCGSSSTHAKITSLSPATIEMPGKATIIGSGALDADQTSASFSLKVKKGIIPFVSGKGSICEDTTIKLPLGTGSFTVKGIDCPAKAGDVAVQVELDVLSSLVDDADNSLLSIHIEANADDTGDQVICLDVDASLASATDFDAYLNKFGKAYNGDDEYTTRKAIYEENMKFIKAENAKGNTHTLGETRFTDITNEEFKALYVSGYKAPSQMLGDLAYLGEHEETASSGSVDWTTKGAVTKVKDQGQCGSCWSFSTTGGLEGAWEIATGQLTSMSEQQFVDCDTSSMGCNGGNMNSAFAWAEKQNVATEQSYPYTAKDGSCKTSGLSTAIPKGGVTGYKSVGSLFSKATVAKLESAIDLNPVSIAIEADQNSFQHYTGGILSSGCGTNLDHGVLAVGYNTAEGYWLVKNSWGASWGDNGYIKLSQTGNVCGILNQPVYPTVSGSVSV
jgi:cathepsin L